MTETEKDREDYYFQKLADAIPVIIWKVDKKGECLYLNQQWCSFTGQGRSSALGTGWLYAIHPDDRQKVESVFFDAVARQISFSVKHQLKDKEGNYRHMIGMGAPWYDEVNVFSGMVGAIVDNHEQKTIETALEKSETRQRLAIESAGMGVWELEVGSGMVHCSERAREIFGLDAASVSLENILERILPEHTEEVGLAITRALQDRENDYRAEYPIHNRNDGKTHIVVVGGKAFFDETGCPVKLVGTCLDVTRDREVELSIRKSEERYRHLFEDSPFPICEEDMSCFKDKVLDLRSRGISDFRAYFAEHPSELDELISGIVVKDMNTALLRLVEAADKKEVVDNVHRIFVADSRQSIIFQLEVICSGGGHIEFETLIQTLKGREVDVLVHIEFPESEDYSGVLVSFVDISHKRKAEKKLKESEEGFRKLANAMPQLVWEANASGKIIYVNDKLLEFSGVHRQTDGSWFTAGMLHRSDLIRTTKSWKEAVERIEVYQIEHRILMRDGSYRWHLSRGIPVKGQDGQLAKWFGTTTDIHTSREHSAILENEVKARTSELHTLNTVLQRSNSELEHFAHMASHDLKEPLRKIMIFSDLISRDPRNVLSKKSRGYLERINAAANRVITMITGVLHYSELNGSEQLVEAVDLTAIFKQIEVDFEFTISQKKALLTYRDMPVVYGSSVMLYQLFYNLINNALKFSRPDTPSRIDIMAEYGVERGREVVNIRVRDNGIGFEQHFAEKIFESFSRLHSKDRFEGSGLGLSLCKNIVQRHNGTIRAFGNPDQGAEFLIVLPVRATSRATL